MASLKPSQMACLVLLESIGYLDRKDGKVTVTDIKTKEQPILSLLIAGP